MKELNTLLLALGLSLATVAFAAEQTNGEAAPSTTEQPASSGEKKTAPTSTPADKGSEEKSKGSGGSEPECN